VLVNLVNWKKITHSNIQTVKKLKKSFKNYEWNRC
jgi:hypothetical protein